jgi:Rod binding domain-containing protein
MINANLIGEVTAASAPETAQLKRAGAAKDFESLLVSQMLRSVREESTGWLGAGDDQASSAAFGLGEEQLARAITAGGGFGISPVIEAGLKKQTGPTTDPPGSTGPRQVIFRVRPTQQSESLTNSPAHRVIPSPKPATEHRERPARPRRAW